MLRVQTATMNHVHTVLKDLSEISALEIAKECGTWWKAIPKVKQLLALEDQQTVALVDEIGIALAIFGHYPSKDRIIRTNWFVCSNEFVARGAAAVLASRKYLKNLQLSYPGTYFHSITASEHPTRGRWFAALGFKYTGPCSAGHHYVLFPNKDHDLKTVGRYNPTNPRAS